MSRDRRNERRKIRFGGRGSGHHRDHDPAYYGRPGPTAAELEKRSEAIEAFKKEVLSAISQHRDDVIAGWLEDKNLCQIIREMQNSEGIDLIQMCLDKKSYGCLAKLLPLEDFVPPKKSVKDIIASLLSVNTSEALELAVKIITRKPPKAAKYEDRRHEYRLYEAATPVQLCSALNQALKFEEPALLVQLVTALKQLQRVSLTIAHDDGTLASASSREKSVSLTVSLKYILELSKDDLTKLLEACSLQCSPEMLKEIVTNKPSVQLLDKLAEDRGGKLKKVLNELDEKSILTPALDAQAAKYRALVFAFACEKEKYSLLSRLLSVKPVVNVDGSASAPAPESKNFVGEVIALLYLMDDSQLDLFKDSPILNDIFDKLIDGITDDQTATTMIVKLLNHDCVPKDKESCKKFVQRLLVNNDLAAMEDKLSALGDKAKERLAQALYGRNGGKQSLFEEALDTPSDDGNLLALCQVLPAIVEEPHYQAYDYPRPINYYYAAGALISYGAPRGKVEEFLKAVAFEKGILDRRSESETKLRQLHLLYRTLREDGVTTFDPSILNDVFGGGAYVIRALNTEYNGKTGYQRMMQNFLKNSDKAAAAAASVRILYLLSSRARANITDSVPALITACKQTISDALYPINEKTNDVIGSMQCTGTTSGDLRIQIQTLQKLITNKEFNASIDKAAKKRQPSPTTQCEAIIKWVSQSAKTSRERFFGRSSISSFEKVRMELKVKWKKPKNKNTPSARVQDWLTALAAKGLIEITGDGKLNFVKKTPDKDGMTNDEITRFKKGIDVLKLTAIGSAVDWPEFLQACRPRDADEIEPPRMNDK